MKKNFNILICAYTVDNNDVGESNMSYKWITRLSKHCNLTVLTTGSRIHEACGLEKNNDINLITLKPKMSFKWWDSFDRIVHPGYLEFFIRAKKELHNIIKKYPIELCHQLTPRSLRYPSPLMAADIPYIVGPFHGGLQTPPVMKELEYKEEFFYKLRNLDRLRIKADPVLKKHYRKAKRLIISAPYVTDVLLPEFKNKCRVILPPPSYDTNSSRSSVDKKVHSKDILKTIFVGRLIPSKGLELLILALSKCRNQNIKLIIYGKGPIEEGLKNLAYSTGVENKIEWRGFVPNQEIIKAYDEVDVFAFPSLKEPTGIALTEAMGLGLPILCVDAGGPSYIVNQDCGIKVPLGSKDEMVSNIAIAIDTLFENPEMRTAMGNNSMKRIRNDFNWDVAVEKMLNVYEEVLSEK